MAEQDLKTRAFIYHASPKPGKIETISSKPLVTQDDLSLGYTPGVAEVCTEIARDPEQATNYTIKGNLVAVITNGTAVLGLGDIGPLASKPVMEGKAVLFKKFANIDVFDIEINETDPKKFIETVERMAPTFGGINLEDIKAPECFEIEKELKERLDIPVMHDDQHGTAIISTAAFINSLHLTGKKKEKVKIVCVGAGAAGLSCMRMLVAYGVPKQNITMIDRNGVIYEGREDLNDYVKEFAGKSKARNLREALKGADYFFGLSAGGILKPEMLKDMAKNPVIFAMANPTPEIMPDVAKEVRPDAIIGTGRSDFPNQINNVLGFPYLFRGALDCGATTINDEMKLAASEALAELARKEADASLAQAYKGHQLVFGPEYIIPKPFDSRLLSVVAPAVAKAAMATGVARRPIAEMMQYVHRLEETTDQSMNIMRRITTAAKEIGGRIAFPEAEDVRILHASQTLVNQGIAHPILIGRPDVVREQIRKNNLSIREGEDFTLVDPQKHDKLEEYTEAYYNLRKRSGLLPPEADIVLRNRWTALAAMMVRQGDAEAVVCGITGRFSKFYRQADQILGRQEGLKGVYALQMLLHRDRIYFIGDTHINVDPTAEQIAEMAELAADQVRHFGIDPRVALLSYSNFGSADVPSAQKMQEARKIIKKHCPELTVEGEMQTDAALNMNVLHNLFPDAALKEPANVLLMPSLDSASIAFNLLRMQRKDGEYLGPMLLGMKKPVHILSLDASVRRIVNISALAVVEANAQKG